jgi:hypothetical protein
MPAPVYTIDDVSPTHLSQYYDYGTKWGEVGLRQTRSEEYEKVVS